jgi:hypothetical protein
VRQGSSNTHVQILEILREAAQVKPRPGDVAYLNLTTADVMVSIIAADRKRWTGICEQAGISVEGYEMNLRWASEHPTETTDLGELEIDRDLSGVRLTAMLASSIDVAEQMAEQLAGSERPDAPAILPATLLLSPGADATTGLQEHARESLCRAALIELHGADVEGFTDLSSARSKATKDQRSADTQSAGARRSPGDAAERLGFNLGTFRGTVLVAWLGGLPFSGALLLGWVVRTVAVRTRKKRGSKAIAPIAVLGLIAAIALAVTGASNFSEDQKAVAELREAKAAIGNDHLVGAMRDLGSAGLLENESVSIAVLGACVDWELGYRDYALFEAQVALNLGYQPEEETHFRGRGCFLDAPDFHGVDFVKMPASGWFVYPLPDKDDAAGQRYLEIAEDTTSPRFGDRFTALACLANRYDMRSLAGAQFTIGLNATLRLGEGETPFGAIKHCLQSKSVGHWYVFRANPRTHIEEYRPIDALTRIPSPQRHDPPDVCWARFPVGGPCGIDE